MTKAKSEKGRVPSVAPVIDFNKLREDDTSSPLVSVGKGYGCYIILFDLSVLLWLYEVLNYCYVILIYWTLFFILVFVLASKYPLVKCFDLINYCYCAKLPFCSYFVKVCIFVHELQVLHQTCSCSSLEFFSN